MAEDLSKCLKSILQQKNSFHDRIEILISDNASSDNTSEIVYSFKKDFPSFNISYNRNDENIGPDNNFINCYLLARGKYFLLFGDDDILLDGKLEVIMNVLSRGEYGVVYLNSYGFRENFLKEKPFRTKSGYEIFSDKSKFISKVNYYFTFISANITNKKLSGEINFEEFKNTNLVQLSWVFKSLFASSSDAFINDYCVAARSYASGGYELTKVFAANLNMIFGMFEKKGVNPSYFDIIRNKMLIYFFPANIIRTRKKLIKTKEENFLKSLYPFYKSNPYFWIFTFPAIIFPIRLLYPLFKIIELIRNKRFFAG